MQKFILAVLFLFCFSAYGMLSPRGVTISSTTDDLPEGTTNLYFLSSRAQTACIDNSLSSGITNKAASEDAMYKAIGLSIVTHDLYVDFAHGTNASGCGRMFNPCATLAYALGLVSSPSATNPWNIRVIGGGTDSETLITWKPNVNLDGGDMAGTVIANGITWTDSGGVGAGAAGAITMAHLTIQNALIVNNNLNGSVDLRLENVDVTSLQFKAGDNTLLGEPFIHDCKLHDDTVINEVQRGWIMASAIYGNLHATNAAILTISGSMLSHYSEPGFAPAILNVGSSSILTVLGAASHDGTTDAYTVVWETGATGAVLRHDSLSYPASVSGTGSGVLQLIDGAGSDGSQPTCSALRRGQMWNIQGTAGVADTLQICQKNAANAYVWVSK